MASTGFHSLFNLNPNLSSSSSSSSSSSLPIHDSYWSSIDFEIDDHLTKAIAKIRSPPSVVNPMRELTFAAPYTTAPALCVAACELVGGTRDAAMAAAMALKLTLSAAQAHDQLLKKPNRRNTTPTERRFNQNIELLTGDGIAPFGFELLAGSCNMGEIESCRILRVITEISRAIGSQGIVAGKYHEMNACGAACGAILGGGNEEEIENLRKYGGYFGHITMTMDNQESNTIEKWEKIQKYRDLALQMLELFSPSSRRALISLITNS